MKKLSITRSVQKVDFSYGYDCRNCGANVLLTGDTMDSFHEASQLFGKQLCVECDRKTIPGKPAKPTRRLT